MATDLSSIAGALKRVYGRYDTLQNLKSKASDEIGKSLKKYSAGGEGYFGAINDYGNEAVGAISETEAFRTIDNEHYQQWKVVPKINIAPIEFSGLSSVAADSDDEAFVSVVVDALDRAKARLLKDENRQFFGLGNGLLAVPAGNAASNVTSFSVDSAQYLRANMVIDIFNGATKTVDSVRISDVDKVNNVVYCATSIGAAIITTDQLVKENIRDSAASDGKEMMGLRGIVDDSTDLTTFQNLNALTNRIWRARRIDASSANLTSDLLQRLIDDVTALSGEEPDLLVANQVQRRKYLDLVVPQKRYMDGKMDAGHEELSFNGKKLMLDPDCQAATIYALNKAALHKFELEAMKMANHDGSDTFLRVANYDKFQAYWRHLSNYGASGRNRHGKITGLATPTGVAG